ncbi:MAG: leucine-rich repeat domain-containing protein [Candidatus Lokiarchaeota archaeon]|nr:leucine-rich repeat domain-containing protein [Candidatus Lokiarchaeota archaeon]
MVKIERSPVAQNDLNEVIDYIAKNSLEYALTFYEQVREKVQNLIQFPKIGRKIPDHAEHRGKKFYFKDNSLMLSGLDIDSIYEIKGLNKFPSIEHLYINYCKILEIQELNVLPNLKTLSLSNNKISKIKGIEESTQLQKLDLGNNQIT